MYPADKYAFTVAHVVNASEKSTLEAFYSANKALPFDFVFRDELTTTYTGCVFVKSPQYKLISRGKLARDGADQAAMSAGPDITTGPGGSNPLLVNQLPIIPVVPVLPVVPSNPTRSDYNEAARPVSERTLTIAGAGTLLPTIFGAGPDRRKITAIVDYGANLVLRCEWCTGGIDSVNALYMDDAAAPAGVIATHYSGSQVTADPTLVAAFAAKGKPYTDTLNGVCCTQRLLSPPGLGSGFPRFVAEIKGKKIAQTSGGTPALHKNGVWFIALADYSALARVDQLGVFHCGGDCVW